MSSIANRLLNNVAKQDTTVTQTNQYADFSTTFEGDESQTTSQINSFMEDFATDFDSVDIGSILSEEDATLIKGALGISVATQMTLEANYAKLHAEMSAT